MTESKLRTLINVGTVLATLILVALIVGLIFQFVNRSILQDQQTKLQSELENLNYQINELGDINNYISENVEDYAREYYGYGKDGEKKYSYDA